MSGLGTGDPGASGLGTGDPGASDPSTSDPSTSAPSTSDPGTSGPGIRVLVCDDQALVRTGFVTIFNAQPDITVVGEAADGRAAVELAERLRPDVVVMDVRMPLMDGIQATTRLAGAGATEPTKVLVVTTFNVDEYVYRALRAGASGFLLKDASPRQLITAIRTVARGDALLAPEVTRQLIGRYAARIRPAEPEAGAFQQLTPRELDVLRLIAAGMSNSEIAAALVVGSETVKTYVSRILAKLGLRDRVQAVVYAFRTGLVHPDDDPSRSAAHRGFPPDT